MNKFFIKIFLLFLIAITFLVSFKTIKAEINFSFNNDLKIGVVSNDVKELQKFLNTNGYTVATFGAGSIGMETMKFGKLTQKAIIKFQIANKLVPDGIVGLFTRQKINEKILEKKTNVATPAVVAQPKFIIRGGGTVRRNPANITAVNITGLIAPVKDGVPENVSSLTTNSSTYSITTLTWSPTDNPYLSSTVYTATVVLTSLTGYKFPVGGIAIPVVDGGGTVSAGTTSGGDVSGNTLTFIVEFPATEASLPSADLTSNLVALYQNGSLTDATGRGNDLTPSHSDPAPATEWNAETSYEKNQLVSYDGVIYRAVVDHQGSLPPPDDIADEGTALWIWWEWNINYDSDFGYQRNDIVVDDGVVYRNIGYDYMVQNIGRPSLDDGTTWVVNAPQSVSSGLSGIPNATKFNGEDNYATSASTSDLQLGGTDFTVAFWMKASSGFSTSPVEKERDYSFFLDENGKIHFVETGAEVISNNNVRDNQWHLIVGVLSSSNIMLYDNGILAEDISIVLQSPDAYLCVGGAGSSGDKSLNGSIAQLAIYKRALSEGDISALYNDGNGLMINLSD